MYGRYAKALEEYPHLPPSNDSMSYFNFDCAMFWLMGSVFANFVPVWLKRTEHRRKFGIEGESSVSAVGRLSKLYTVLTVVGTTVEDCCTAYWCLGCALAQQNLDIQERAQENAPVVTAMPYKTGEKMTYSRVSFQPDIPISNLTNGGIASGRWCGHHYHRDCPSVDSCSTSAKFVYGFAF